MFPAAESIAQFPSELRMGEVIEPIQPQDPGDKLEKVELGPDRKLCEGDSVILNAAVPGGAYLWSTGETTPSIVVGGGIFWVQVARGERIDVDTITVEWLPAPTAAFESSLNWPVEFYSSNTEVGFTATESGASRYHWDFGDGRGLAYVDAPIYSWKEPGSYWVTLTVENEHGCKDSVKHGPYTYSLPNIFIPNAFSPNGDQLNDEFMIKGMYIRKFELSIYNRSGVLMFQTMDKQQGWDGTFKGEPAPEGNYVYVLRYIALDAAGQEINDVSVGTLTLIR